MKHSKIFKSMYELPRMGIFEIRNDRNKEVYISYSKNLVQSVSRNILEMKDKIHVYKPLNYNIRDWKFSIIETLSRNDSLLDISCKVRVVEHEYRNKGYTVKLHKNIMQLRFRVDIDNDFKVYCKLITKSYNEYVVGIFKNMKDAEYFVDMYRNMGTIIPVYANNELTREYFERQSG